MISPMTYRTKYPFVEPLIHERCPTFLQTAEDLITWYEKPVPAPHSGFSFDLVVALKVPEEKRLERVRSNLQTNAAQRGGLPERTRDLAFESNLWGFEIRKLPEDLQDSPAPPTGLRIPALYCIVVGTLSLLSSSWAGSRMQ